MVTSVYELNMNETRPSQLQPARIERK